MARLAFTEFEEFVDALRGVRGRYLPTTRGTREWRLRILDLGRITLMMGQGGAANLYHGVCLPDCVSLLLPLSCPQWVAVDGSRMTRESVAWLMPEHEFQFRAFVPIRWLALNLHREMVRTRLEEDGNGLVPLLLGGNRILRANAASVADIAALARRAFNINAEDRDALHAPVARDQLCGQLLEAALRCLTTEIDDARGPGRTRVERREVVARAVGLVDLCMGKALGIEDLCRATGVSARTLHAVFIEQLGLAPYRYLALRRLCAIHAAMRTANDGDTVASICARFGVWDFGRFSNNYRRHFGRLPSQVIGRRHRRCSTR